MAWKETVEKSCADRAAALTELFAQLVAMGWTLHDNMDASNYRVYKSNGENSDRLYEYIKIDWATANYIKAVAYLGWNATAHTGSAGGYANYSFSLQTSETGFLLWIYGNKDLVFVRTKISTTYYISYFGHFPKRGSSVVANVTSDTGSGSSVTINVSTTDGFEVGKNYQIVGLDAATGLVGYRYQVQVTAIGSGTLTLDSLDTSLKGNYTQIGVIPSTFGSCNNTYFCPTCPWPQEGSGNVASYQYCPSTYSQFVNPANADPDTRRNDMYLLSPWYMQNGSFQDGLPFYCDEFILAVGTLTPGDVVGVTERDSGTAESGGTNTLTDTDKSWTPDAWIGKTVVIKTGTGAGQVRKITDNDATSLTVSPNWATTPSSDSAYVIVDEAYRVALLTASNYLAFREGYA